MCRAIGRSLKQKVGCPEKYIIDTISTRLLFFHGHGSTCYSNTVRSPLSTPASKVWSGEHYILSKGCYPIMRLSGLTYVTLRFLV
ncbi:hypothetical protein PMIN01_09066 [Paraphaeosphaeria minitans]|uniref:Uncharacterized protein n=1 Tax=Paraphaeosphaeria minitans TaxID=565426 RepID=A0A9P6GDN7_9PLEO|nr:hypothetical protein PMIN01_09066 [Paraphaeosphaeria minitans]